MIKKSLILFLLIFEVFNASAQSCSKLRRICRANLNNEIFWRYNLSVPCGTFKEYRIFGRDKPSSSYTILQTVTSENTTSFSHIDANLPSNKNWDYFIETVYDCGGTETFCYSDTQNVSQFYLPKSSIAYVTVDIDSELPVIIWEKNSYPSFWYVDLFNDNSIKTSILDTFFIDKVSGGNPKTNSLKYVIAAVDSCTNRWDYITQDFHYTINLKGSIDTCTNSVTINWSQYIGWKDPVSYYYIYKMVNKSNYILIDSVLNNVTSYTNKIKSNELIDYCVAAVNSKFMNYKSFSNSVSFASGIRNSNHNLKINYVTLKNNIVINIDYNASSDINTLALMKSTENNNFTLFKTISKTSSPLNIDDINEDGKRNVYYYLASQNVCSVWSDTTAVSGNILLTGSQISNDIQLNWNRYSTWNNGVEYYTIQRETRVNEIIISPFSSKTNIVNNNYSENTSLLNPSEKYCYKIIGKEKLSGFESESNMFCMIGGLIFFFPTGIIATSNSSTFKPVGAFIDYTKSKMFIYNRWGEMVKEVTDLKVGWDLTDNNNKPVAIETYIYDAFIVGLDDKKESRKGTITIIR